MDDFLSPIESISSKVLLSINNDKISTIAVSPETGVILAIESDVESNMDGQKFAFADIRKFNTHLKKCTDLEDNNQIIIDANKVKYNSSKWRFTLTLLDESILGTPPFTRDKIDGFEIENSFVLRQDVIKELISLKAANKEAPKVYFKFLDDGVYADLTDYSISNTDVSGMKVCEKYTGGKNAVGCPVVFNVVQHLAKHKDTPFKVKYNGKAFMFQTVKNGVSINYIISETTN